MFFWSRHRPSPPDERVVFLCVHASSDDDNRYPFQLSLVHAIFLKMYPALNNDENDNETKKKKILTKCPSLMDGPGVKRFSR